MKRVFVLLLFVLMLSGCGGSEPLDQPLALRKDILSSNGCSFTAKITADYIDVTYTFTVDCVTDQDGKVNFTVIQPESIAGISGSVSPEGGELTFDEHALAFPVLADGELSPVIGPYVFMKALRGGYINGCGKDNDLTRVSVEDSYENDALHLDLWLDKNNLPIQADIHWQGRRVLLLQVTDFKIL